MPKSLRMKLKCLFYAFQPPSCLKISYASIINMVMQVYSGKEKEREAHHLRLKGIELDAQFNKKLSYLASYYLIYLKLKSSYTIIVLKCHDKQIYYHNNCSALNVHIVILTSCYYPLCILP